MKIRCKHCNEINVRDYTEVIPDLRANHFFRLTCNKCGEKTLVTYKHELTAITDEDRGKTVKEIQEKRMTIQ